MIRRDFLGLLASFPILGSLDVTEHQEIVDSGIFYDGHFYKLKYHFPRQDKDEYLTIYSRKGWKKTSILDPNTFVPYMPFNELEVEFLVRVHNDVVTPIATLACKGQTVKCYNFEDPTETKLITT